MKRAMLFAALAIMLVFVSVQSYAIEGGNFQTPDAWSQHFSFGGVKYSTGGAQLGDSATLDATLTSRTNYRSFDSEDSVESFVYLRAKMDDLKLFQGVVKANFFARYGFASEDFSTQEFNPLKNAFYVERGDDSSSARFYQANVVLDEVIPYTNLTAGRFYLNHIDTRLMDGGDIKVSPTDMVSVYGFYGLPVSHYVSNPHVTLAGGGLEVLPLDFLKIRGEYSNFKYDHNDVDFTNDLFRARLDAAVLTYGNVYFDYTSLDSTSIFELGAIANLPTRTTAFGSVRFTGDYIDENTNDFLNPYNGSLSREGKNTLLAGEIAQGVTDWLVVAVGADGKLISGTVTQAHREYFHIYGNVDFNGLIDPNLYISLNSGYWFAPEDTAAFREESSFELGAQVSYTIAAVDLWFGTSFEKYRYFDTRIDQPLRRKEFKQDVRMFYLGGQYAMTDINFLDLDSFTVGLDLSTTSSNVYNELNNSLNDELDTRIELNLNVVL